MQTDWPAVSRLLKESLVTEHGMVQLMSDRKYAILCNPPLWTGQENLERMRPVHKYLEPHWVKKAA
jgi:hypothetical protein